MKDPYCCDICDKICESPPHTSMDRSRILHEGNVHTSVPAGAWKVCSKECNHKIQAMHDERDEKLEDRRKIKELEQRIKELEEKS